MEPVHSKYMNEQDRLTNSIIDDMFYKNWREDTDNCTRNPNLDTIELNLTSECNNDCKYCYLQRYGDLSAADQSHDKIFENSKSIIDFLISHRLVPKDIEIFCGDFFYQPYAMNLLEYIYKSYSKVNKQNRIPNRITIPSNMWYITNDKMVKDIRDMMDKFDSIGMRMCISASVDGKYCESNRPSNINRDDKYYDALFKNHKVLHYGFHPMVYSSAIENWIKNFDWFMDMFAKYDINPSSLYLLEVRNAEWSTQQIQYYYDFVVHILDIFYQEFGATCNRFYTAMGNELNIFNAMISHSGRGVGCSIQADIGLRVPDLKVTLCHRTSYEELLIGDFDTTSGLIFNSTPELLSAMMSLESKNMPFCQYCMLRDICSSTCLGSAYEVTGSMFEPIPTVCKMYFAKIFAVYDFITGHNLPFPRDREMCSSNIPKVLRYIHRRNYGHTRRHTGC